MFPALLIAFVAGFTLVSSAQVQSTVRELRENAFQKFASGEFESAIPDILMLIDLMKDIKTLQGKAELEMLRYNLGIAYFLTAQFKESHNAFVEYKKLYPHGNRTDQAYVYIGDGLRFSSKNSEAIKAYREALAKFNYKPDLETDIHAGIARCYLAMDDWEAAREPLYNAFRSAPDRLRRNRAATMLVTCYLKTLSLDDLYPVIPFLLDRDSQAARSIVFNLSAMEAGDLLFSDERYREALWLYRLVFPYEEVQIQTEKQLEYLKRRSEYEKKNMTDPRRLMRLMEWIGDAENELETVKGIENYDLDLFFRIARGYMEARRYREGCEGFLHLHEVAEAEVAEESLYLAFVCASKFTPLDRCYEIARQYMDEYPGGFYYDDVTILTGQLYCRQKRWLDVIKHFDEVLKVRPNHQMAAECLFLLGYAHFMEEQFAESIGRLRELRERFPGWEQIDAAIYWTAMALMFSTEYEQADKDFTLLLEKGGSPEYLEDGTYRRAVCSYALSQFDLADQRMVEFLEKYPEAKLRYEAQMVRGDIAGAVGRTDDAVKYYQLALETPDELMNIEYYNHCAFQCGQVLYDAGKFDEVRSHFASYIERNREGSNVPLAVYWTGRSMFNSGEQSGAARYYLDAAQKFGGDRKAMGVDLILDEWIGTTRRLGTNEVQDAWNSMIDAWKEATLNTNETMKLRYQRVLMYRPDNSPKVNNKLIFGLLDEANLKYASPAVMEAMLDLAKKRSTKDFCALIAEAIVADFTETDIALDARLFLAQYALEQAEDLSGAEANALRDKAIAHLTVIRNVFATSGEAAEALLMLGRIHRDKREMDEARECFNSVLGVKAWRPLWPEALYNLGLCAEADRDRVKATAYYERIYVMYSHYGNWAAKAYLRRAECLSQAFLRQEAKETLDEMLALDDLKKFPEYAEAEKLRAKLEGQ